MSKKTIIVPALPTQGTIDLQDDILKHLGLYTIEAAAVALNRSVETVKRHLKRGTGHLNGEYLQVTDDIKIWVITQTEINRFESANIKPGPKPKEK